MCMDGNSTGEAYDGIDSLTPGDMSNEDEGSFEPRLYCLDWSGVASIGDISTPNPLIHLPLPVPLPIPNELCGLMRPDENDVFGEP